MNQSVNETMDQQEGDPLTLFLTNALKTNPQKVAEVMNKLQMAGVSHEDLMTIGEKDLRPILSEDCTIGRLQVGRILSTLKKTEGSAIWEESKNTKFVKIFVTPQETEAFAKLTNATKITADAMTRIQGTITKLEANRESSLKAVNAAFNVIRSDLDQRESVLNKQINDLVEIKKSVLNEQSEKLTKYNTSLHAAQKEYHSNLEDQQLNDHDRSGKNLREIEQAINSEMKYDVIDPIVSADVAFGYDSQYKVIADKISEFGNVSGSMKPPEISVTNIKWNECKVSVRPHADSTGSRLKLEKNEVRYCSINGQGDEKENGDDDEKKADDKSDDVKVVEIVDAEGEMVISGLHPENEYSFSVRACYEQIGFTKYSDEVTITTPKKIRSLGWDRNRHGNGLVFVNDQRVKYTASRCIALADYVVRREDHDTFEWTLQGYQWSNYSWIGFVNAAANIDHNNWSGYLGNNPSYQCSIGPNEGGTSLTICGNLKIKSPVSTSKMKKEDVFKFVVDFRTNQVTVHHNGASLGVLWSNVYDALVPAASNNYTKAEYTISGTASD